MIYYNHWSWRSSWGLLTPWGPFYWDDLTLISAWISNHIHYKVWGEITYPFPNFNGATVEVWEWISNFISLYWECDFLSTLGLINVNKNGSLVLKSFVQSANTVQITNAENASNTITQHNKSKIWCILFALCRTVFRWDLVTVYSLQWRHNERDGVSNHRRLDYLLNRLFRCTSKKT